MLLWTWSFSCHAAMEFQVPWCYGVSVTMLLWSFSCHAAMEFQLPCCYGVSGAMLLWSFSCHVAMEFLLPCWYGVSGAMLLCGVSVAMLLWSFMCHVAMEFKLPDCHRILVYRLLRSYRSPITIEFPSSGCYGFSVVKSYYVSTVSRDKANIYVSTLSWV